LVINQNEGEEEFEDTEVVSRIVHRRRTDKAMAKRKRTKAQITIYKTYIHK
jgi:hypothetical protein